MLNYMISGDRIDLLDNRFYRDVKTGIFCPSITTYLEAYPKGPEYYSWLKKVGEDADEIRDEAGRKGSNVHKMIENYLEGLEVSLLSDDRLSWKLSEWAMFTRFVEFYKRHQPEVIQTEMTLIDTELREAGTLDLLCVLNGKKMIIDFKTSNAIYPSYWLQIAAYKRMFERLSGEQVDGCGILWLNAKTRTDGKNRGVGWQLLMKDEVSKDIELFDHTKALWIAQNKDIMPRNVSYKIVHKICTSSNTTAATN